jgi:hypothetical protein
MDIWRVELEATVSECSQRLDACRCPHSRRLMLHPVKFSGRWYESDENSPILKPLKPNCEHASVIKRNVRICMIQFHDTSATLLQLYAECVAYLKDSHELISEILVALDEPSLKTLASWLMKYCSETRLVNIILYNRRFVHAAVILLSEILNTRITEDSFSLFLYMLEKHGIRFGLDNIISDLMEKNPSRTNLEEMTNSLRRVKKSLLAEVNTWLVLMKAKLQRMEVEQAREDMRRTESRMARLTPLRAIEVQEEDFQEKEQNLELLRDEELPLPHGEPNLSLQDPVMYSYREDSSELYRTQLLTGEVQIMTVRYLFRSFCCWLELRTGDILITGGGLPSTETVEKISMPDLEVARMPSMHSARRAHASVQLEEYVYVLGGSPGPARAFERLNIIENRWEMLSDSPKDCEFANAVARRNRIYVFKREHYQEYHVKKHTWKAEMLKTLNVKTKFIPCFKTKTDEIFIVANKKILAFESKKLKKRGVYSRTIMSIGGQSTYMNGRLFLSSNKGGAEIHEVGRLD